MLFIFGCVMSGLGRLSGIRGRASRAGCSDSKDGSSSRSRSSNSPSIGERPETRYVKPGVWADKKRMKLSVHESPPSSGQ